MFGETALSLDCNGAQGEEAAAGKPPLWVPSDMATRHCANPNTTSSALRVFS